VFLPFPFFPSPRERTGKTGMINRYRVQSRSDRDKDNGEAQTQTQRQTRGDRWQVSRGFDMRLQFDSPNFHRWGICWFSLSPSTSFAAQKSGRN
jgi:hypothetical protein